MNKVVRRVTSKYSDNWQLNIFDFYIRRSGSNDSGSTGWRENSNVSFIFIYTTSTKFFNRHSFMNEIQMFLLDSSHQGYCKIFTRDTAESSTKVWTTTSRALPLSPSFPSLQSARFTNLQNIHMFSHKMFQDSNSVIVCSVSFNQSFYIELISSFSKLILCSILLGRIWYFEIVIRENPDWLI